MDVEKLIESVSLCGSTPKVDQCKQCAYWSGGDMSKCIPRMTTAAATALSTLQAENAQLRADLEYEREHADAYYEECGQWEAENEKLREELENYRKGHCSEGGCAAEKDRDLVIAENEKLRDAAEGMRSNWYKFVEKIKKLRAELEQVKAALRREQDGNNK